MNRKFFGASREDAQAKVADRSKSGAVMSAASAVHRDPSSTGAWDPYEVWLTRVKQPRDRAAARSSRYLSGTLSQQPDLETPARIHRAAEHPV
jgi:hypothetical protein